MVWLKHGTISHKLSDCRKIREGKDVIFHTDIETWKVLNGDLSCGAVGMRNLTQPLPLTGCQTQPLTAYHVLLTAPFSLCNGSTPFELREFERVTVELSAQLWRRCCGPIYLLTDGPGEAYFHRIGLSRIYDGMYASLDCHHYGIDLCKYWAAGKIQALLQVRAPCVILDLDMLVWRRPELSGCRLAAAHSEPLLDELYPPFSFFLMSPRYTFPADWSQTALPLNTSFVYFADDAFKDDYARQAIRFMQYERDTPDNGATCMIFAEQRILGMCAAAAGIQPKTFLEYGNPLARQDLMTHLWSAKTLLHQDSAFEEAYCTLCREKLQEIELLERSE